MLADSDSAPDAVLPSQHPLPCARTAACALSSSESEQSCMYSTHRQALDAGSVSTALPVSKSVKRRRAESVLAAQAMGSPQQRKRQKPDSAQVAACKLAGCRCGTISCPHPGLENLINIVPDPCNSAAPNSPEQQQFPDTVAGRAVRLGPRTPSGVACPWSLHHAAGRHSWQRSVAARQTRPAALRSPLPVPAAGLRRAAAAAAGAA